METTVEQPYQRPSRLRTARMTSAQIREAIDEHNVDLLNEIAAQRKLPGYEFTKIALDNNGKGLCLRASQFIAATSAHSKTGLCEYGGTERSVSPNEHVNSVPQRVLMYGCEYYRNGQLYRKSPDQDMESLLRYMQAPNPGEEPTCRLFIVRDTANYTKVCLFINKSLQPNDELTIEYGGQYWQIFWHHLSLDQQRGMKTQYPDVTFPPHWPQVVAPGYHNQAQLSQLEHDYSLAARNIYDVLSVEDTMDEVDNNSDNEEHGSSEEPHEELIAPPLPRKTHAPTAAAKPTGNESKTMVHSSIITSINPSRHIFRGWNPQTFPINVDVGLDVGKALLRRMYRVLKYPEPAFQSNKDLRDMMMKKLWKHRSIDDIQNGSCGPQIQRCMHDTIQDLGRMNETDMRDQITFRMTKTTHQDQPPYYSVQDTVPIQHLISGLIEFGNNDIKDEWNKQPAPYVVVGTHITMDALTDDCDAVVEINEEPPLIILWTRRRLDSPLDSPDHNRRPRQKTKYVAHREHDKPP
jgi:hypothetical protein